MAVDIEQLTKWIDEKFPGPVVHKKNCALPECFKPFYPKRRQTKYCSPQCAEIAYGLKIKQHNQKNKDKRHEEKEKAQKKQKEFDVAAFTESMKKENEYKSRLLIPIPRMEQRG